MTGQAAVNNKGFLEISPSEKGVTSTSHWNDCATPAPIELLHEEGAGFKGAHRIDLFSENTTMGSQSHSPTTPTEDSSISMTTIDASNSPLIIPYDASLSEGLRLLIMHHLHGCNIDTDSLSANELSPFAVPPSTACTECTEDHQLTVCWCKCWCAFFLPV